LKAAVDTSVLLALGKLGYLNLLGNLFDTLFVAQSVFEEISGDETVALVHGLSDAGLVEIKTCSNHQLLNLLSSSLGKGEAETIVLALELKADAALLDDLKARKTARRLKITVMGTIAVLKALLDLKLIKEAPEDVCQLLIEQGFWIDAELCIRKKLKIEEGTRLEVKITDEGILLKPKKSIWDMLGAYSQFGTPEEVKKEIDQLRHEDE